MHNILTIPLLIFLMCFVITLVQNGFPKSKLEVILSMLAGTTIILIVAVIAGLSLMFNASHFFTAILSDGYNSMLAGAGLGACTRGIIGFSIFLWKK